MATNHYEWVQAGFIASPTVWAVSHEPENSSSFVWPTEEFKANLQKAGAEMNAMSVALKSVSVQFTLGDAWHSMFASCLAPRVVSGDGDVILDPHTGEIAFLKCTRPYTHGPNGHRAELSGGEIVEW